MRRLATALAILMACVPAADAAVRSGAHPKYLAPPGNSAVTQYLEVVPTAAGAAPASTTTKPSTGVTATQQRLLGRYGATGQTLATVVRETSPSTSGQELSVHTNIDDHRLRSSRLPSSSAHGRTRTRNPPGGRPPGGVKPTSGVKRRSASGRPSGRGDAPVGAVLSAATGHEVGGGIGILLPLLAIGSLALVVIVTARRRGGRDS